MKIFNNGNINKIQNAYKQNKQIDRKKEVNLDKQDKITISEEAKMLQKAIKLAKDAPDVRQEKVAEIKARMEAGTYKVDSKVLAKKLLEDIASRKDK